MQPQWVEVNASGVRVENCRQFGGPWLALEVAGRLQLDEFLKSVMPSGREHVSWWRSALILVVARLCHPSSELYVAEHIVTTMEERYGKSDRIWVMDRGMVSDDNIDFLRAGGRRYIVGTPKSMLKKFAAELLKDDWNTIRDGLEVKLCSRPRNDDEVADADKDPVEEDKETFILCRSPGTLWVRSQKEEAIVGRFEQKIEARLVSMAARCEKQKRDPMKVEREIGRLLGKNTRVARLFEVTVEKAKDGAARIQWKKIAAARDWATLSGGRYLLRSNVTDWSDEELWKAYIQLTETEAAFCIQKSDLKIRPIWHQKEDRVLAHIFVCFLAYVL